MRTGIRFGVQVAVVGVLAWGALPPGSWGWVNNYPANQVCVNNTSGGSCSACSSSLSSVGTGCAWVQINAGALRPGSSVKSALFRMGENQLTESIYTPQSLSFVVGYAMKGISHERTRDGAPRQVTLVSSGGIPFAVNFKDGESIGVPVFGDAWVMKFRVFMVDANGWSTLSNPAYYDLYTGDGERYRFNAFKTSAQFMQLVNHRTVAGREETYQDMGVEVIRDSNQILRQVLLPTRLADIVATNYTGYAIKFYTLAAVNLAGGKDSNGCYRLTANAAPFESWIFANPEPNTLSKLRVTRLMGSRTTVYDFTYESDSENWVLQTGDGVTVLKQEEDTTRWNDDRTLRATTSSIRGADGSSVIQNIETIQTFSWGDGVTRRITDPQGACLTNTFTYTAAGLTESAIEPDGSWRYYRYDSAGRATNELSGFMDSALTSVPQAARSIATSYTPVDPLDSPRLNDQSPRSITESILGTVVAKSYRAYRKTASGELQEIDETAVNPSAAYGAADSLRTVTTYYGTNTANHQIGRLASVVHPDGRQETYSYDTGTYQPAAGATPPSFAVSASGDCWRVSVVHGTTNQPQGIAGQTTKETTIIDVMSQEVLSETWVSTGGGAFARVAWRSQAFDEWQHPVLVTQSNGEITEASWGGNCCGKEWERDSAGGQIDYTYDALSRVQMVRKVGNPATSQPDLYTTNVYDTIGRQIAQTTFADGIFLTTSNVYDSAGRQIATSDAAGLVTTYAYPNPLTSVTISPGLLTNTTVRYPDGQTKCTLQNGVIQSWYNYGVSPNGTRWAITYTGPAGLASPVWQKTTTDLLGRTIKTEQPGFSGAGVPPAVLSSVSSYNTAGQLIRTSEYSSLSASAPLRENLFFYDPLGNATLTAQDLDLDGEIDLSGPDRVTSNATEFVQINGDWYRESRSYTFPEDNSATAILTGTQRQRLTGLGAATDYGILTAETISLDLLGNQTLQQTHIDRDNAVRVGLVSTPDSTNAAISVTINGLAQYSISKTGVRTDAGYDALGRQISATNPRTGVSTTHYNSLGQVDWVADALTNITRFSYCPTTGRRISVTDAISNTTHTAYDPEGRVIATWGATYPVAYAYDAYGRMIVMATFRVEGGAGDQTQWLYDEATGLLTNKVYADGKGPSYTYTPQGQLATRTWARGVVTTYSYTNTTGELIGLDYSDSTPDVAFAYDRLGRQVAITDATGTRSFAYNDALQLAAETNAMGVVARAYDGLGRSAGFSLDSGYSVTYGYSALGRFASVTSSVQSASSVVEYSYLPNSDLISGWSNGILSTVKNYEAHRDLISSVANTFNGQPIGSFAYANDALARRVGRVDNGAITNTFGYNPRSELSSARMGTNAYGYAYDPIGNRLAVTNNAAALTYTANALNQYTNIADGLTLTPVYDLDGNMTNYNGWTFVWDGENRLVLASNAATVESNYYDYMSRRVQMIVNGVTNRFEYDGWNLASETTSTGVTNFYVWGIDLSGSLQGAGGIGGLMAVVLNGHAYHPVADANGNVTDYVATNGTVVAHREFDAFGNTIVATGSMVNDFNFWFSSKYQDQDTGLYYYGYRFLSTELGRWVNRDPITEGGGLNLNCFVNNNSLANVDANGLLILNPVNPGNGVPPYIISPPIPGYPGYTPPPPNPQPTPTPSSFALPNFAFGLATSYKVTGNIPAGPGAVTISVEVKVSDGTCCKDGAIKSVAKVTGSVSGGYVVGVGIQPLSYTWNANGSLGNIGNCPATGVGNWKWQVKFEIKVGVTQANCTYAGGSGWTCGAGFNSGSISWNATMSGTVGATADFYRLTFTPLF